jgi:methylated-DNA-[protein]-cysteine S-methyltransferase
MTRFARYESPLGPMFATAEEDGITHVEFVGAKYAPDARADWIEDPRAPDLAACGTQLAEYFAGKRTEFDLPLAPQGSEFQQRVWREIARVPYGKTISYGELAARAGAPGQARAAGAATGRNPVSLVIPCHRIVGSDGSLTGYAGGLERKRELLELEGVLQRSLV